MSLSMFDNKDFQPTNDDIQSSYDETKYILWQTICHLINQDYPNVLEEWKFYSKKAGWSLVIKSNKRTMIYLIPGKNEIKVNLVFGSKATEHVLRGDFSDKVKRLLNEAHSYVEGRSIMFDVISKEDVDEISRLLKIKNKY
ncbi:MULTISPECIES: DUF3788 family protein [unclassified Enterococcus]|uniref:DUF3788 family protein n=1 Tax=unclassified Enterococcus TaxID=2608891 RepID=UPI0015577F27|nr:MULTISPECIES: DUF3788 family protein [unclassified Enterococcus]MBS7577630.1 DUF3788 family protein [Enterococcus sp. MMGLQ5-2]MBS7584176.1 DUF3788 family protein [Enterococcus sp. MMGLQ5-1]NPD12034.1 DUF3788 family protein [Enterococcus sp. MMGLQ5-1]NPD37463.1 DUF3788 family protein [Enterococcus sp. MMGLQ5-2]